MVWYFIGVYVINRTLRGRLEIQHFSSSVEKYFTSVAQRTSEIFFQHEKRNFVSPRGHVISSIFFFTRKWYIEHTLVCYHGSRRNLLTLYKPFGINYHSFVGFITVVFSKQRRYIIEPGAHKPERASFMHSCHGVFTDQFIFSTVLARILNIF